MERAACRFAVRLTPRAARDEIRGTDAAGALMVRVTAAPVDGAANEALVRLVARELDIGRNAVAIESGATARRKRIRVTLDARMVEARWPGIAIDDRARSRSRVP
jgi:uncharacterized protein YggU (UPF0235/DUF167 family)